MSWDVDGDGPGGMAHMYQDVKRRSGRVHVDRQPEP